MKSSRRWDDDDGHTVADMNVEGMPWYDRAHRPERGVRDSRSEMSPTEKRATLVAVVLSSLGIAAVFGVVYFAVIALMDLAF